MRPSSGTTAPSTFGSDSDIARGFVGSFVSRPLRSRFASWAWTLEDDVRPTASPISRTVGGYPRVADRLRDDVQDPLLPGSDVRHGH